MASGRAIELEIVKEVSSAPIRGFEEVGVVAGETRRSFAALRITALEKGALRMTALEGGALRYGFKGDNKRVAQALPEYGLRGVLCCLTV